MQKGGIIKYLEQNSKLKSLCSDRFRAFIKRERLIVKREMSQKEFAKLLGVKTSTVNAMETNGLCHKVKIYYYLEKLGYEPVSKLEEIMNNKL